MNKLSNKSIALIGLKHCGKSTVGKHLAPFLNKHFVDLDQIIAGLVSDELLASGILHAPLPEFAQVVRQYYRHAGSDAFRTQECMAFQKLSEADNASSYIIACGGGAMENEAGMQILHTFAYCVYIAVPEDLLYTRILKSGIPPFLDPERPRESFHELYERRTIAALHHADMTVEAQHLPFEQVVASTLKTIKEF